MPGMLVEVKLLPLSDFMLLSVSNVFGHGDGTCSKNGGSHSKVWLEKNVYRGNKPTASTVRVSSATRNEQAPDNMTQKCNNRLPSEHTQVTKSTSLSNEKEGKSTTRTSKHLAKHTSAPRAGLVNERSCAYFMPILVVCLLYAHSCQEF